MCFSWEALLSVGRAANKPVWYILSTTEAEYITSSAAAQEAMWVQQLTSDLLNKSIRETIICENNQSTIILCTHQESAHSQKNQAY